MLILGHFWMSNVEKNRAWIVNKGPTFIKISNIMQCLIYEI